MRSDEQRVLTGASFRGNRGSKCFRWLFLCWIGHTAYSVSFFYCELYAMLCRGLSKCLHLLMWVNQHRRAVGVWIPNTGGRTGPFLGGFAHLSVSPAVGLCLWGESNPSEFWQPGTLMGSGVCERSPSSTLGIQPRGKKLGGHKECSLKSLLISPCSAKASFLVRLNI